MTYAAPKRFIQVLEDCYESQSNPQKRAVYHGWQTLQKQKRTELHPNMGIGVYLWSGS